MFSSVRRVCDAMSPRFVLAGRGVDRPLPGQEHEVALDDRLGVRPDGPGRLVGGDGVPHVPSWGPRIVVVSWRCRCCSRILAAGLLLLSPAPAAPSAVFHDLVIHGGRVMDPESGLDAVRDVGVSGGRIAAVSVDAARGPRPRSTRAVWSSRRASSTCTRTARTRRTTRCARPTASPRRSSSRSAPPTSIASTPSAREVAGELRRQRRPRPRADGGDGGPAGFLPPATARAATEPATDAQLEAIRRGVRAGLDAGRARGRAWASSTPRPRRAGRSSRCSARPRARALRARPHAPQRHEGAAQQHQRARGGAGRGRWSPARRCTSSTSTTSVGARRATSR